MSELESLAQYERIAMDLANRIAKGEMPEGKRISGRTVLSSEYHVSPETVRKAMALLADMKVIAVREKSGATVISRDSAARYVELSKNRFVDRSLMEELKEAIQSQTDTGRRIKEICQQIMEGGGRELSLDRCPPSYEMAVGEDSDKTGHSIGELNFWQATGATITAIRRGSNMIVSPGPYAELFAGDVLIFTGGAGCVNAVRSFLEGKER